MKFTNDELGCSFEIADRPTVRQQLLYWDLIRVEADGDPTTARLWQGVARLVTNWQCAALPDPATDLDAMTDPTQARVVAWAALRVFVHFNALTDLPKA